MPQHFLLSAKARTLSLRAIFAGGEEAAYKTFCGLSWPETNGDPVCPHCGSLDAYSITTRRRFKCADCGKQYSVTSGTIFHSRKKSFTDLLAAACIIVNSAKGLSALQLSPRSGLPAQDGVRSRAQNPRGDGVPKPTAAMVGGDVEIDGAYFGGHIRPANDKGGPR
jgi:hypothetical protein